MKKVFDWLLQVMGVVFIGTVLLPGIAVLLLGSYFFIGVGVLGLDPGPYKDDRAVAALENTGMTAYVEYAPYHAMCIDKSLTAFILPKYDNHTDKTDLRAGIMACAAELPNWHVEAFSCDKYVAKLNVVFPEATFLLPADVTFDAWYEDADRLAFFDQDTGLMVHLRPDAQPHAGRIKADGIKVPHNGFLYEYESHGGFHGDGTTFQTLIVPEDKRDAFEADIAKHADWHEGKISCQEYRIMQDKRFFEIPALYPSADVDFEWWCYVDAYARSYPDDPDPWPRSGDHFPAVMQEAGAVASMNWLVALYDADTGLFIFYRYDS